MGLLHSAADLLLHLPEHLSALLAQFHVWLYGIVFAVIFAETGLVVAPFLPGDSLLFALGALTAVDRSGTLHIGWLLGLLIIAAAAGNTVNYAVGRAIGPPAFSGRYRFFRLEYLWRTEAYFHRHGGATVLLSRFVPIVRTFAPFVAGIGRMPQWSFQASNLAGAAGWVALFLLGGYGFGNVPWVKQHFGLMTLLIIGVSLVPLAGILLRAERAPGRG
jgi:membrane-associated protein